MVFARQSSLWDQLNDFFPDDVAHVFRELFSNPNQRLEQRGVTTIFNLTVNTLVRGPISMVVGTAVENWCKPNTVKVLYRDEVIQVFFMNTAYGDPNVVAGQEVRFYYDLDGQGTHIAVGGYIDRKIGQLVLWDGVPPPRQGWAFLPSTVTHAPNGDLITDHPMDGEFICGEGITSNPDKVHTHDPHDAADIDAHDVGFLELSEVIFDPIVTIADMVTSADSTGSTTDFNEISEVVLLSQHQNHHGQHAYPDPGITTIFLASDDSPTSTVEGAKFPGNTPQGRGYTWTATYGPGGFPNPWDSTHTVTSNPHTHEHSGSSSPAHTHDADGIPSIQFYSDPHKHDPGLDVESPWEHVGLLKHEEKKTLPPYRVMGHFIRVDNSCNGPWKDQIGIPIA